MKAAPPLGVSFDLDSTLLDTPWMVQTSVAACSQFAATRLDLDQVVVAKANADAWASYWPEVEAGWILGSPAAAGITEEAWRRTLASLGCMDAALLDEVVAEHVRQDRINCRLFADCAGVMDQLRASGISLGLVTNGASTQRSKLDALGVTAQFRAISISADVGAAKPDVAIFEHMLGELGLPAGQVWHVGDNLRTDVAGAQAAGMTAVWLNREGAVRTHDDPVPDLEIATLEALLGAMRLPA